MFLPELRATFQKSHRGCCSVVRRLSDEAIEHERRERPVGSFVLGRRMYEVLSCWENPPMLDEQPAVIREFAAIWRAAVKVVYSRTLGTASSARTRIERDFDPEAVRGMKASAARDLSIGGPEFAAQAIKAALVDEVHLLLAVTFGCRLG